MVSDFFNGKEPNKSINPDEAITYGAAIQAAILSDSILSVSAVDKITRRSNKITITNDKDQLSKEEIERMIADAEKYRAEDEKFVQRIQARNSLESYIYNLRNTLQEHENIIQEAITWLENNQEAEKEEYEHKQELLEKTVSPNNDKT
ncbi:hsp71-like protein [Gigaspora margarita]|uniref:Hsp71-like protein n=1 Tax=Gigaspora margarita TaxID=4874 RepID=A0A8H4ESK2_GIGMA|nr:hsp71-like protein [Gigaspora margarita]